MRYRDVDVRTYIIFEEDCTNTLKIILNSSWRESRKYCRFVENIVHCNVENTFDTSYQEAVTVSVSSFRRRYCNYFKFHANSILYIRYARESTIEHSSSMIKRLQIQSEMIMR